MKYVSSSSGRLVELRQDCANSTAGRIHSGLAALDNLFGDGLARGAIHELLHPARAAKPMFPAMILAKAAIGMESPISNSRFSNLKSQISDFKFQISDFQSSPLTFAPDLSDLPDPPIQNPKSKTNNGVIVLSDPHRQFYPPAAAQLGIPLARLYLLHPANREQELWAIGECLASAGVTAVVAQLGSLTQVEARRLQLSAERSNAVGLLIRPAGKVSAIYAAATRTLVTPTVSNNATQAWTLELLHGHGCPVGRSLLLEYNREEHTLHTSAQLADHKSVAKAKTRASA